MLPRRFATSAATSTKDRLGSSMDPPSSPLSSPPSDPPINRKGKRKLSHRPKPTTLDSGDYDRDTPPKKLKPTTTSKGKSGVRKLNKAPLKASAMASTFALSPAHDQMLISERDAGTSWPEIRRKWEEMTGDATAHSTLPNRYARLKSLHLPLPPSDQPLLIEAKHEIDAEFERSKWEAVGKRMAEKGASQRWGGKDVKRAYERLMVFSEELRTGVRADQEEEGEGMEMEE